MPENIKPLTVDEISAMLMEEWGRKEIITADTSGATERCIDMEELDEYSMAEERYYSEQIDASKAEPLKKYYLNPQKENLTAIKSRLGRGIVPEFSYLATFYLRQMLEGMSRGEGQEKAYQTVMLQERIFATPDDVWKEALRKNANELKYVTDAPDVDEYAFPSYLFYSGTLKIEGDTGKLVEALTQTYGEEIERIAKSMINFGIYEIGSTTGYLGVHIAQQNHLTEKGLDGFINSNMLHAFQKTDKDGDAYFMRFFVVKEKVDDWISGARNIGEDDTSANRSADKEIYAWSREWRDYLLESGLKITQMDEKIQPMPTRGGYLDATAKMNCGYALANRRELSPCSSEAA